MKRHPFWFYSIYFLVILLTIQCSVIPSFLKRKSTPTSTAPLIQPLQPNQPYQQPQPDTNPQQPEQDPQQNPDQNPEQNPQPDPFQNPDQNPQPGPDQNPQPQDIPNNNPGIPADFKLTGIWEAQVQTEYGMVYTQLILEPTMTFSQQAVWADLMTYDVGTYVVGDGFIHFNVENHEPKIYKGKEMTWVNSFTYFYTVVDANTMNFEDRIVGSSWTVYRK